MKVVMRQPPYIKRTTTIRRVRRASVLLFAQVALCLMGSVVRLDAELVCSSESAFSSGKMMVCWKKTLQVPPKHVLVHFHGGTKTLCAAFEQSDLDAVLAIVNFPGLSTAYSRPFESDAKLFPRILDRAAAAIRKHRGVREEANEPLSAWHRITLSSFSAGYGAVREILKSPEHFSRIDAIVAADSIYASIQAEAPTRQVDEQNMSGFLRFANLAATSKKSFTISHSAQPTPYASTTETANYLLRSLNIERRPSESLRLGDLRQKSVGSRGQFVVLGFGGMTGQAHMRHLRHIDLLWTTLKVAETSDPLSK